MIIKYTSDGEIEWTKSIKATEDASYSGDEYIESIKQTSDGGYIVVGKFSSKSIDLGNGVSLINNDSSNSSDGMIIKYSVNGEVEWAKGIGGSKSDEISLILKTKDNGYIVGGSFNSSYIELESGVKLINKSESTDYSDAVIIKYSAEGKIEWAKTIGDRKSKKINSSA